MRFRLPLCRVGFILLVITGCSVLGQTPAITSLSSPHQVVLAGQALTLSVSATSSTPLTYQWRRNGLSLPGATVANLALTAPTVRDSGWYQVVVSNTSGSTTSAVVFVNVALTPAQVADWGQYFNNELTPLPTPPSGLNAVARIAAGRRHSLALKHDGTIAVWGWNSDGQLNVPAGLSGVVGIAGGGRHCLALRSNGSVVAWGSNSAGQLSVPGGLTDVVSLAAGEAHSVALRSNGTVSAWGDNSYGQSSVPSGLSGVVAIAASFNHTLALRNDGTVVAWGDNTYGQTTVPAGLNGITAIAAGFNHSLALRANGTVAAWGRNEQGQANVPATLTSVVAIAAGDIVSFAVRSDGVLVGWGSDVWGQLTPPPGLTQVADVGAGSQQAIALRRISGDVAPSIVTQPLSQVVTLGQSTTLSVSATGTGLTYQWRRNGSVLTDATSATLSLTGITSFMAATYDVIVANNLGSVTSAPAVITLGAAPVFSVPVNSVSVPVGQSATFTAVATGTPTPTFQWRKNGTAIAGATASTYVIAAASTADVATYDVVATNSLGSVTSNSATFNLLAAPTITSQPSAVSAQRGQTVTLRVVASASPDITGYQWRKDGQLIGGNPTAVTGTLVLNGVGAADAGNYDVLVTNAIGSTASALVTVTVILPPAIIGQPAPTTVIAGQSATFTVSATSATAYQWRKDGNAISGNASATTATLKLGSVTFLDAGGYDVVVTGAGGTVSSVPVILEVLAPAPSRLVNVSILTRLPSPTETFTVGAVVGGAGTTGEKPLLIRAAGPALAQFSVPSVLSDPRLEFFRNPAAIGSNDNWGTGQSAAEMSQLFSALGAFPFGPTDSRDAALLMRSVTSADHSVRISSAGGTGAVLAEIYDATPVELFSAKTPRLINLSVLKRIDGQLTAGFVIAGTAAKAVLIRAIGPSLAGFNVPDFMADPKLELFNEAQVSLASNDDWGGTEPLTNAFRQVAAFGLPANSKDAALVQALAPGAYTVQISAKTGADGVGLVEIYELP